MIDIHRMWFQYRLCFRWMKPHGMKAAVNPCLNYQKKKQMLAHLVESPSCCCCCSLVLGFAGKSCHSDAHFQMS